MTSPLVTVAVPSFNQGQFLEAALRSIFDQNVPLEVFVIDGGSTDGSIDIIEKWSQHLAGWRSHKDGGQAEAINEGIASGTAPYVCWINSDDLLLPGGLRTLLSAIQSDEAAPMSYGRSWDDISGERRPTWVEPFNRRRLALRCIVSQPATLIRRTAWEAVGGLDDSLQMAMDYDLWWKLYKAFGPLKFVDAFVATNRVHGGTKTNTRRGDHYREAMAVVRKYNGRVPLKWWLAQPLRIWMWRLIVKLAE